MWHHARHGELVGNVVHGIELGRGVGGLEVDPNMAVQVGLVTCSILADSAHKWLFSCVNFDMSVQ